MQAEMMNPMRRQPKNLWPKASSNTLFPLRLQTLNFIYITVAGLRIRDVYPGSRILIFTHPGSRIPDPKTATKERGEKKFVVIPIYVATNFTKL